MKHVFLTVCLVISVMQGLAQATVKEISQSVKTYPFSDPNPVAEPSRSIYPYFRFDGYTVQGTDRNWKVVKLENPYIKVTLLPEVGGKIWGAVDKTTNREFVYQNNVMKFRNIAMRGPWTSGGIEFNFGIIGHVPSTATPVDYLTEKKGDGSASCYISSYEWVTHTWWTVEVNVPADKAYFTTRTVWHNGSGIDQPYYQWMNAGYQADGDAEFCYPGTNYIGHGGDLHSFPYDPEGRHIGTYKGNNSGSSSSFHVLGKYNDFYGVYWHDNGFGSVHYADYADKLGMKIFLWGIARRGAIWEDLLTDGHGQYIELQSGRMFNQPAEESGYTPYKHTAFAPQGTDDWTEYWFPVEHIGNVLKANNYGALNVMREDGRLKILFSPLQELNTEMKVYDDDRLVKTFPFRTEVLKVWENEIPLTGSLQHEGTLKIRIGNHLLTYSEKPSDNILHRPKETPTDFDWTSVYGLYLKGEQLLNQKNFSKAEMNLKNCLEKDPHYMPAQYCLASLYYREGKYKEALELCRKALSVNAYDGKTNYLYGLCNRILGNVIDAKDGFSVASRSTEVRSAAYEKLAEMFVADEDYVKAVHFASLSLESNAKNLSAERLLMTIYRKSNQSAKARDLIEKVLKDEPLYHPVRYEAYKSGVISKTDFTAAIRNELVQEVYMELANEYEEIESYEDAIELLSMIDSYPIATYKRAYLLALTGKTEEASSLLKESDSESPLLVFPHRPSTLISLNWAADRSKNWKIDYYRALIYWANRQTDKAKVLLEGCENVDFAPFYLTRASLRSGEAKLADLKKAEQMEKSWRVGFALQHYYMEQKDWKNAEKIGRKYMKLYPGNYIIGLKYANVLCQLGQNDKCISLLSGLTVLPNEGAWEGRVVYRRAHLNKAVDCLNKGKGRAAQKEIEASEIWPENLGVGKPFDRYNDTRLENYLAAEAQEKLGDKEKAIAFYRKVTDYKSDATYFKSADLLNALSLKALGKQQEADALVKTWAKYGDDIMARCCTAIYQGDAAKAKIWLDAYKSPSEVAPWESSHRDSDFELVMDLFTKK